MEGGVVSLGPLHVAFALRNTFRTLPNCRIGTLNLCVQFRKRLQPLCFGNVHPAELLLPAVKRRRRNTVFPAHVRRLHPSLILLQYPDNLLFTEPALLHRFRSVK